MYTIQEKPLLVRRVECRVKVAQHIALQLMHMQIDFQFSPIGEGIVEVTVPEECTGIVIDILEAFKRIQFSRDTNGVWANFPQIVDDPLVLVDANYIEEDGGCVDEQKDFAVHVWHPEDPHNDPVVSVLIGKNIHVRTEGHLGPVDRRVDPSNQTWRKQS